MHGCAWFVHIHYFIIQFEIFTKKLLVEENTNSFKVIITTVIYLVGLGCQIQLKQTY